MLELLTAPVLSHHGFVHGFSLRQGGVSAPPYDSLNLGRAVGDEPSAVEENHRRFADALGIAHGTLCEASQVHGAAVRVVRPGEAVAELRREHADALVAASGGAAVGVRVADCLALLLADPDSGCVSAVHAGWRGAVAGVVERSVEALCALSAAPPARLVGATLPHIRQCCFEVGPDVAQDLLAASPDPNIVDRTGERPRVALQRLVEAKLKALGLLPQNISDVAGCTRCEAERFFSYRRQGARSGRHIAAIVSR